ncbi:MAG: hypothetical protein WDZ69_02425 [Candidatus Pacearchaeota archaeon]
MIFVKAVGIIGILLKITGTVFIITKKRFSREKTYIMFLLGGVCLLTYSILIKDIIFIIFQSLYICIVIYGIVKIDFSKRRNFSSFERARSVLKKFPGT